MNISETELRRMIHKGENRHLEIHGDVPNDDALARVLCAFANTRGGSLILGVGEERKMHGCVDPDDALSRVRLVAEEDIKPALDPEFHRVKCELGTLILVRVAHSDDRPHSIPCAKRKREIMVRVGPGNHVADGGTLNALRSHRNGETTRDPLEKKILLWIEYRERETAGDATPELFGKATNVGLRRASKAFVSLECSGLLIGRGERYHRYYALP